MPHRSIIHIYYKKKKNTVAKAFLATSFVSQVSQSSESQSVSQFVRCRFCFLLTSTISNSSLLRIYFVSFFLFLLTFFFSYFILVVKSCMIILYERDCCWCCHRIIAVSSTAAAAAAAVTYNFGIILRTCYVVRILNAL